MNPLLLSGMVFALALGFAWLARAATDTALVSGTKFSDTQVSAFPAQHRCPPLVQDPAQPSAAPGSEPVPEIQLRFSQETALSVRPSMKFAGGDVQFRRETCFERVSGLYCGGSLGTRQFDVYPKLDESFAISHASVIVWNDADGSAQTFELACEPIP
jgi:hypothetical protein